MTLKTALALSALLLPLVFGVAACDSNSTPAACAPGALGISSGTDSSGVALSSSAAQACAQGLTNEVESSTGTVGGSSGSSGSSPAPTGTAPVAHRGQNN